MSFAATTRTIAVESLTSLAAPLPTPLPLLRPATRAPRYRKEGTRFSLTLFSVIAPLRRVRRPNTNGFAIFVRLSHSAPRLATPLRRSQSI